MKRAELIYASSESDADLLYATRFVAPDPFAYARIGRKKILILSDLEVGRGREQAEVDEVLSLSVLKRQIGRQAGMGRVLERVLRDRGVRACEVPSSFPLGLADKLRDRGIRVTARSDPFIPARVRKTPEEVRAIERTQRAVESAVRNALGILRRSKIRGHKLVYRGKTLTSESIRRVIGLHLMERDCVARNTIIACGDQGCDSHNIGSGPLRPERTIILDVFPRSMESHYFADMTRTVVKGRASKAVRRLYAAVHEAQETAFAMIRHGVRGSAVHREVKKVFERLGYRTEPRGGKVVGFPHGTGHGVGLQIHEMPRISLQGGVLPAGAVVTVEPGLYYPGVGGVRLEDMVLVTKKGCRSLTRFPRVLEL